MTTTIRGTDNTAAAPALTGTDTDTGIFFPAADTIAFAEGGVEVGRFDSAGQFGIGTQSPDKLLDVEGDSASTTTVGIAALVTNTNTTSNTRAGIVFRNFDNYGASIWSPRTGGSNGALVFGTNGGAGIAETNIAERGRFDNAGNFYFNSGYGSSSIAYGCRAWVAFNGTGTVAIRGSGNVSSITDNGTGNYTINFSSSMPDANYEVSFNNHAQSDHIYVGGVFAYNTGSVQCYYGTTGAVGTAANTRVDAANYGLAVFR